MFVYFRTDCEVDGVKYPEGTQFEVVRGCDVYSDCECFKDGDKMRWDCSGTQIKVSHPPLG